MLRTVAAAAVIAALAAVTGCTAAAPTSTETAATNVTGTSAEVLSGADVTSTLAKLPQRSVAAAPATRLADGLVPPTNRWFSGLVFGSSPEPVFPSPLSFGLTSDGFAFGLPLVTATANTIAGGYRPDVTIAAGAAKAVVVRYDEVSVTVELRDSAGAAIGRVLIAEGSPFVTFTAARATTLASSVSFADRDGVAQATVGTTRYAALGTDGAVGGRRVKLAKGASVRWFPVPTGGSAAAVAAAATGVVTSVSTSYDVADKTVSTSLGYNTGSGRTVVGVLPHQSAGLTTKGCTLGSYATVYGTMRLCASSTLTWHVSRQTPSSSLDLSALTAAQKSTVVAQLKKDAATRVTIPDDTYGGGKALYRIANLLTLATQLGQSSIAASLTSQLRTDMLQWADVSGCTTRATHCFVYDPAVRGVVGLAASYGSDQFNDHHFHYGYLLYAAAVLAQHDKATIPKLKPVFDAVAADIAGSGSSKLPTRRVYDPYFGHSWASGYSPFADGNNQESSSEAVNAWNALALWGSATGQSDVQREAVWLLSNEASVARSYQVYPEVSQFAGFEHSVVGIDWGGKRDFATWFTADPVAVLGIQLIPMSPVSTYLTSTAAREKAAVQSVGASDETGQFGDYLLMYLSLAGGATADAARAAARTLPDAAIDTADSRAYLLAYVYSH
ncbi:glycosyl hydrolase [Gryllotalpicola ginsengisoli]|uniref:glycosyl hydrolase n=1 Tax=Gryllotalpicola ginsengisoli TaxID=444608 RepID=UPI0003B46298|nr:glycosyl hydrolase [Gryllotalpicola ginsengisoli]